MKKDGIQHCKINAQKFFLNRTSTNFGDISIIKYIEILRDIKVLQKKLDLNL